MLSDSATTSDAVFVPGKRKWNSECEKEVRELMRLFVLPYEAAVELFTEFHSNETFIL